MPKSPTGNREGAQGIEHRPVFFHEALIGCRVDAERGKRDDDLSAAFRAGRTRSAVTPIVVLERRKDSKPPLNRGCNVCPRAAVRGKRDERHGSHVDVGRRFGKRPAPTRDFGLENGVDERVARRLSLALGSRWSVVAARIERDECPDGAVHTLPAYLVEVAKGRKHVIADNIRRIEAQRG